MANFPSDRSADGHMTEPQDGPQSFQSFQALSGLYPGGAKALMALWAAYLLTGWFLFLGLGIAPADMPTYFGVVLSLGIAECMGLFVWDWHNLSTLFETVRWRTLPRWERLVGGAFFFTFPTLYLVLATVRHFRAVGAAPRQYVGQLGRNLRTSSGWMKAGLVAASLALVIAFCSSSTMVMALAPATSSASALTAQGQSHAPVAQVGAPAKKSAPTATAVPADPTALPTPTNAPTVTPMPTAVPATPTPKPQPTATPKPAPPAPTPTPKPIAPTATPQPTCSTGGAPSNPWCYTFNNTGKLIYSPPSNFCSYFACIGAPSYTSFWNGKGYVVECNDGDFSKSGGIQGACSYHSGVQRPLYQP